MPNNPNRQKQNKKNIAFTIIVAAVVAAIAGAVLVIMVLASGSGDNGSAATSQPTSSTSSLTSSAASSASGSSAENTGSQDSSSASSEAVVPGKRAAITQVSDRLLVVVNNETTLPSDFKKNLKTLDGDVKVDKELASAFDEMYNAAYKDDCYIWITYGYRSKKAQNTLYNNTVNELKAAGKSDKEAKAEADKTVQKGGCSEYITGLSIGLNTCSDDFAKTDEYKWLIKNAYKYGFVLRFPEDKTDYTGVDYQPWRFRYVGKKAAKAMHEKGYCLEEYVASLTSNTSSSQTSSDSSSEQSSN